MDLHWVITNTKNAQSSPKHYNGHSNIKIECHMVNPCIKVITITRATRKTHCMSKIHTCPQKCVSGAKYTKMQETFKIGYHKVSPTCKQAKGSTNARSQWTGAVQSAISKSEFSRMGLTCATKSTKHVRHSHNVSRHHMKHSQGTSHHCMSKKPKCPKNAFPGHFTPKLIKMKNPHHHSLYMSSTCHIHPQIIKQSCRCQNGTKNGQTGSEID